MNNKLKVTRFKELENGHIEATFVYNNDMAYSIRTSDKLNVEWLNSEPTDDAIIIVENDLFDKNLECGQELDYDEHWDTIDYLIESDQQPFTEGEDYDHNIELHSEKVTTLPEALQDFETTTNLIKQIKENYLQ